jgi:hypothetical protein
VDSSGIFPQAARGLDSDSCKEFFPISHLPDDVDFDLGVGADPGLYVHAVEELLDLPCWV